MLRFLTVAHAINTHDTSAFSHLFQSAHHSLWTFIPNSGQITRRALRRRPFLFALPPCRALAVSQSTAVMQSPLCSSLGTPCYGQYFELLIIFSFLLIPSSGGLSVIPLRRENELIRATDVAFSRAVLRGSISETSSAVGSSPARVGHSWNLSS